MARTMLKEHAAREVERLQQILDGDRGCLHVPVKDFLEVAESVKALWMRLVALEENACLNKSDG